MPLVNVKVFVTVSTPAIADVIVLICPACALLAELAVFAMTGTLIEGTPMANT